MSWRTVIVTNQAKLDYKMGYMVVRGEETKRVLLDEIAVVVIENPAVSVTGCLIEALIEKKIKRDCFLIPFSVTGIMSLWWKAVSIRDFPLSRDIS